MAIIPFYCGKISKLFLLLKSFVAGENKYSGLDIPKNIFSSRAHAENK